MVARTQTSHCLLSSVQNSLKIRQGGKRAINSKACCGSRHEASSPPRSKKWMSLSSSRQHQKDLLRPLLLSSHCLVNETRKQHGLEPVFRSKHLDELAAEEAQRLADAGRLDNGARMRQYLLAAKTQTKAVTETMLCGSSVLSMHKQMLHSLPGHRRVILSRRYNEIGVGTAKSKLDGQLYLVQILRYNPVRGYAGYYNNKINNCCVELSE